MATSNVHVSVSESGAYQVQRSIRGIGQAGKDAQQGLLSLQNTLTTLVSIEGLRRLGHLLDSFTDMTNRMRVASNTGGNFYGALKDIFDISQRTRSSMTANAQLFQQMSLAQKDLGATNEQILAVTEGVGQAMAIQGGLATTSAGAILQFSQALGSSRVQAEEFNSVITGLRPLAQAAADGIDKAGGSISRLRKMIVDGEVTSKMLFEGVLKSLPSLQEQFGKTIPTISQAFTVLGNSMLYAIGIIDSAEGASAKLSKTLIQLAEDPNVIAQGFITLGVALGYIAASKALRFLVTLFNLIRAHPVLILVQAVALLVTYFSMMETEFEKNLKAMGKYVTVIDRMTATFVAARAGIQVAWQNFPDWLIGLFKTALNATGQMVLNWYTTIENFARDLMGMEPVAWRVFEGFDLTDAQVNALDSSMEQFRHTYNKTLADLAKDAPSLQNLLGDGNGPDPLDLAKGKTPRVTFASIVKEREGYLKSLAEEADLRKVLQKLDQYDKQLKGALTESQRDYLYALEAQIVMEERVAAIRDQFAGRQDEIFNQQIAFTRALNDGAINARQYAEEMAKLEKTASELGMTELDRFIEDQEKYLSLMDLSNAARDRATQIMDLEASLGYKLSDAHREEVDALLKQVQVADALRAIRDETLGQYEELEMKQTALNQAYERGYMNAEMYRASMSSVTAEMMRLQAVMTGVFDAEAWATNAFASITEGFQGVAVGVYDVFSNMFQNLSTGFSDMIGDWLVNGGSLKDMFGDLARQILSQMLGALIQVGIQWAVNQLMAATSIGSTTALQAASAATTTTTAAAATAANVAVQTAAASTIAAAYAPAAALASLASFGGNAAPAMAGLTMTTGLAMALSKISAIPGFEEGGWTGNGGRKQIAGVVHGQEFVVNADAAARNRDVLEAMNSGATYDYGGYASAGTTSTAGATTLNVTIIDESGGREYEVQQLTPNDVRVIAREVVAQDTDSAVAASLSNPNSRTSKTLAAKTSTSRRY